MSRVSKPKTSHKSLKNLQKQSHIYRGKGPRIGPATPHSVDDFARSIYHVKNDAQRQKERIMSTRNMIIGAFAGVFITVIGYAQQTEPTVANMPPVVVKTIPQSGDLEVDPGLTEIRVTFSKDMMDGSWS